MNSRKFLAALLTVTLFIGLLALAIPTEAAVPQSRSFLAVQSIYVTNTANVTNFATAGAPTTNFVGVAYTNLNRLVVVNTTSAATNVNASRVQLLQDVSLWSLENGAGAWSTGSTNHEITYNQSYATLSVTATGGSGSSAGTLNLLFTPIYNGDDLGGLGREATASAQEWLVGFTPTTSLQTLVTNVPLQRWPGATKLRCRRVLSTDTDASSGVIIEDISLNGFVP